jgi:hypothetical protein
VPYVRKVGELLEEVMTPEEAEKVLESVSRRERIVFPKEALAMMKLMRELIGFRMFVAGRIQALSGGDGKCSCIGVN